ncbi:MAG: biotin/lipoyl-binding protein [Bacteroidia bacterium]|jgi:biotin carboxyl carrier protein|nr:biotin/lipoyl-binding protein [Bacteroidia bacterium]
MITIKLPNQQIMQFAFNAKEVLINGVALKADWITIAPNKYHVLINAQSYTIEWLGSNENGKEITFMVNGRKVQAAITDSYDALLQQLGMDKMIQSKVNDVKAPMPGLVLRIMVEEGQSVQKGDSLLVLEAMKMENVIKASGQGTVKKILVQPKQTVDKNQTMIVLD